MFVRVVGESRERPSETYSCLVELNGVDVGSPCGDEEIKASEYICGTGGLEQIEREVGHQTGCFVAREGSCTVEGGLQGWWC
jgi:hypothetical protein